MWSLLLASICVACVGAQCVERYPRNESEPFAPLAKLPYHVDFEDFSVIATENWATTSVKGNTSCSSWLLQRSAAEHKRTTPSRCRSGVACWATGETSYTSNEDSAILSPVFDFSALTEAPVLSFWIYHNTVAVRDGLFVETTTSDGADATWTLLGAKGDALWYGSSALVGGNRLVDAFSGNNQGWKRVSRAMPAAVGQARFRMRLRFVAGGAAPTSGGGVLIDDIVVSRSALPDCPLVTNPAIGAALSPLPFAIEWNAVAGVPYYDVRYAPQARFANASVTVGAGVKTSWTTPANADGVYSYQVLPRAADGTYNPFCDVREFFVGVQSLVTAFPYRADFDNGNAAGWNGVDYDTGRFSVGAFRDRAGAAFSGSLGTNEFKIFQSPPIDFSKMRSAIMQFDILYDFASGGATLQFSQNRGQSWHEVGSVGAGQNWYTKSTLPEAAAFLNVPVADTPPSWSLSRATFARAIYNINSATMPRGLWVPCHPEVYFRFIAASGVVGGGSGLAIDDFSLRPDPSDPDPVCSPIPTFSQNLNLSPAPTPVYVAPTTTTSTTTTTTTTTATTTPTRAPTTTKTTTTSTSTASGTTTSSSGTSATTDAGTTEETSTELTTTTTEATMTTKATTSERTTMRATLAPTRTSTLVATTPQTNATQTTPLTTTLAPLMSSSVATIPPWAIAIIILGCLLCCLLLLLLLCLLRRKQKKEEEEEKKLAGIDDDGDDGSELGRSEDDDEELGRAD